MHVNNFKLVSPFLLPSFPLYTSPTLFPSLFLLLPFLPLYFLSFHLSSSPLPSLSLFLLCLTLTFFFSFPLSPLFLCPSSCMTHLRTQNYLRKQENNKSNYNLVVETLKFLDCICGVTTGGLVLLSLYINMTNVDLINQCLSSLTEYCQGPCHENQVCGLLLFLLLLLLLL